MERTSQQRELVYCWQCENEWYKDEHGLQCPRCESNFVEIVENNNDPSMDQDAHEEHPLHSHNPWSDPPETDIDDIRSMSQPPGSFIFQPGFVNPPQRPGAGPSPPNMGSFFGSMMNLMGTSGPGMSSPHHHHPHQQQTANGDDNPFRSRSAPGSRTPSQQARSGRPHFEIYTSSGPGFSFRATSSVGGGGGGQFSPSGDPHEAHMGGDLRQYVDALRSSHEWYSDEDEADTVSSRLVDSIIGAHMGYRQGDPRGEQTAGGGFAAASPMDFLQHLMNPAGAPSGDFASSQQAFDQILSSLMEEHQSGNAPGPASAEAIDSLPKKTADAEILGNAEKEDCSICMSEVKKGDVVNVLPCNHWFHPDCAKMWLKEHDTCPICRVGIMPKDEDVDAGGGGSTDPHGGRHHRVRSPGQAPLHNEDPFELARRQSGTRNNPIIVPESPTRDRRHQGYHRHHHPQQVPSGHRRYSSDPPGAWGAPGRPRHVSGQRSPAPGDARSGNGGNGSGGITGGLRRMFGGTGGGTGGGGGGTGGSSRR
ncbi:MAG: hypothetical protein M1831_004451 [Alyxoria varia]|nr:MAG: hypothetical protein M1831_004451 [Alyxoria varia]